MKYVRVLIEKKYINPLNKAGRYE